MAWQNAGGEGIIPALAGNTTADFPWLVAKLDHPRSRGEYMNGETVGLDDEGSSPLSRGIPQYEGGGRVESRIIPALAGNT